jgi:DNA helicase-2/ATP-dependent DNA helicase PcrA
MQTHLENLEFLESFELGRQAIQELEQRISRAPVDVRNALARYEPRADAHQRDVIDASGRTIRVVAPAGSGKTQTLVNRVLARVQAGTNPTRILALTFDNSAAESLRSKLREQLDDLGVDVGGIRVSTLNAYGYSILREYFPSEFSPVVSADRQRRLAREVLDALKEKSPEKAALLPDNVRHRFYTEFFSLLKNEMFDPRAPDAQRLGGFIVGAKQAEVLFARGLSRANEIVQAVVWLFMAYERSLQRDRLIDFDDQKLRAYASLAAKPAVLAQIQGGLAEVIVDEFQDINRLDFCLIRDLSDKSSLVVTGDDDQAIYGFRGCTPDFIINLEKHLGRAVDSYELRINYRCPPAIVARADQLIRHNRVRIPKAPVAASTASSSIKLLRILSSALESKTVVSVVRQIKRANKSLSFADFAVLYRTNAQSLPLQIEFILSNIPFYVRDEDNVLSNEVLQRLIGTLRLKRAIANRMPAAPADALAAVRAYFRFVQSSDEARLAGFFSRNTDFMLAVQSPEFIRILPKAKSSNLVASIAEVVSADSLLDTLDVMARKFNGLEGMIGSIEDAVEGRVPLGEIYELAASFRGNSDDFVEAIETALAKAKAAGAGKDRENGVSLLTYFKSKGLQWHTVILTSCNERVIPHSKAPVEDERRLFYVAMTRASSNLVVSYVKRACKAKVEPSRFLKEAGLL